MSIQTLDGRLLAGRYRIRAPLGRGGMADVFDGMDERLERAVAIKVLRPEMAANPDIRRRFEVEARAAARLSHPNVVAVFDTGEDDGLPFIIMERLPGETLADRMASASGPVDGAWISQVAGDVLLALGTAHSAGIIHRDIKPGNVLIGSDGCAKVADFGIAKSIEPRPGEDPTATNLLIGTPAYLAPERIEGRKATPQSDLYSLGVVLYEALAGRKPFEASTPFGIAHAAQTGDVVPLRAVNPDVAPAMAALVARAMSVDPADRFPTADAMRLALGDSSDITLIDASSGAPRDERTASAPTTLLDRTEVAPFIGVADFSSGKRWHDATWARLLLVLASGVLAFLLVLAFVRLTRGDSTNNLSTQLHDAAASIRKSNVPNADISSGLDNVADVVARHDASAGAEASALLRRVTDAHQAGSLTDADAARATSLLESVPGVDASQAVTTTIPPPTTTTTVTPAVTPTPPKEPKKGHGKKGD